MTRLFPDTDPRAEKVLHDLLRQASPARKLEMVAQGNAMVRQLMMVGLRERYPIDPPEKLKRRLADLLLGPELALKVYGPLE
ncbi:MAG: hypothetical protein JXB15_08930 [Anaerolineales bacterium]|nr:hypothetical protein [Anaerolineales bacterium]